VFLDEDFRNQRHCESKTPRSVPRLQWFQRTYFGCEEDPDGRDWLMEGPSNAKGKRANLQIGMGRRNGKIYGKVSALKGPLLLLSVQPFFFSISAAMGGNDVRLV
jgi:hypothetical protein